MVEALPTQCSAKGCRAPALWQLRWNNPKIHTPEYRKTWLAWPVLVPTASLETVEPSVAVIVPVALAEGD